MRFGQGKRDEAFAHYVEGLVAHPLQSDPRITRSAELVREGRAGDAVESLRQAVVERPFCAEGLDGIGVMLASGGRVTEGLDFFTASVTAAPDYSSGHYNRGRALLQLRRYEEAVAALREAIRYNPDFIESYAQLAMALAMSGANT